MQTRPGKSRLDADELAELQHWQRRMVSLFVITMSGLLLTVILDLLIGLSQATATIIFLVLVALVVLAGFVQFSQKCPACGYRLGFQSRLLVPDHCKCCGIALK
jgi:hypothetical protein